MSISAGTVGLTLEETVALLAKHGVQAASFTKEGTLTHVAFHAPTVTPIVTEPFEDATNRVTPVDAAAIALAGRTQRQTAGEP